MDIQQRLNADERLAILMRGNTWAYNLLLFALLIDILYRAVVFDEAAWDLFALIFASGVVGMVYPARHSVWILTWKSAVFLTLVAAVSAIVAFIHDQSYVIVQPDGVNKVGAGLRAFDKTTN
jgi:hypothetical protein